MKQPYCSTLVNVDFVLHKEMQSLLYMITNQKENNFKLSLNFWPQSHFLQTESA